MSDERFTIKPQDDYWAVVDNYNDDKVCIINGIHTEIEAIWLCDLLNEQQATIEQQTEQHKARLNKLIDENGELRMRIVEQQATINKLRKILAEAEDMIETRLAEHYLKQYENIKHHIIGDSDE